MPSARNVVEDVVAETQQMDLVLGEVHLADLVQYDHTRATDFCDDPRYTQVFDEMHRSERLRTLHEVVIALSLDDSHERDLQLVQLLIGSAHRSVFVPKLARTQK